MFRPSAMSVPLLFRAGLSHARSQAQHWGCLAPISQTRYIRSAAANMASKEKPKNPNDNTPDAPVRPNPVDDEDVELLYGMSSVHSALVQGKRQHKCLVHMDFSMSDITRTIYRDILRLAEEKCVYMKHISQAKMKRYDKLGTHQGVILKTSPLPFPAITSFGPFDESTYEITLNDEPVVLEPRRKFPLFICTDQVKDEGNLGSIIRSAFYFGADGVFFSEDKACKPSPLVSKVSAGALERINVYKANATVKTLKSARKNGWRVIGATVDCEDHEGDVLDINDLRELNGPTIIVLGSEDAGIRFSTMRCCDSFVYIESKVDLPEHFDSLNVGIAAGVLLSHVGFVDE